MEKTLKISNKKQIERLIDFVEQNPDIGRGKVQHGSSRQEIKDSWVMIAEELNCLGPPSRTGPEWQRVWIHYKANIKRKLAKNKEHFMASDGGPPQEVNLTENEKRVCALTQVHLSVDPSGYAFEVEETNQTVFPSLTDPLAINESWPNKTKTDETKMKLLEDQAITQNEILQALKKMECTQHKIYLMKQEKLKLLKEQEAEKSALRKLKIEIAIEKLKRLRNNIRN